MPNNLATGNQGAKAKANALISDTAISAANCLSILKIGNPNEGHNPALEINNIDEFVEGEFYVIKMKAAADLSDVLITKLNPEEEESNPSTTAYRLSGAAQNITVASPSPFHLAVGTPAAIGFYGKLTAADAAFRMGWSDGVNRVWDINFKHEGGVVEVDAYLKDSATSGSRFSSSTAVPMALNTKYFILISWDGSSHASILINNVNGTADVSDTGDLTALATTGNFAIGQFAGYNSNNAEISDMFICAGAGLTSGEATEIYNGGTRKDVTTASFYASKVTSYWPLLSNLLDAKGSHNGTATTPQFV